MDEIAQLALERKTGLLFRLKLFIYSFVCDLGARALRSIIEKVLLLAKFEVPGTDIESVHVTRECVRGGSNYIYRRRDEESGQKFAVSGCA